MTAEAEDRGRDSKTDKTRHRWERGDMVGLSSLVIHTVLRSSGSFPRPAARFIHLQSSYRRTVGSLFPSLRSSLIRSHSRRRPGREPEGRPEGAGLTSRPGLRREGVESRESIKNQPTKESGGKQERRSIISSYAFHLPHITSQLTIENL